MEKEEVQEKRVVVSGWTGRVIAVESGPRVRLCGWCRKPVVGHVECIKK